MRVLTLSAFVSLCACCVPRSPPQVVVADTPGHRDFLRNTIKMLLISDTIILTVPAAEYYNAAQGQLQDSNLLFLLAAFPATTPVIVALTYVCTPPRRYAPVRVCV